MAWWKPVPGSSRSRVARRVFLLCVLCALLPTLAIGTLVYTRLAQQEEDAAHLRLQDTAKRYGMLLNDRLVDAENSMIDAASRKLRGQWSGPASGESSRLASVSMTPVDSASQFATAQLYHLKEGLSVSAEALRLTARQGVPTVELEMLVSEYTGRGMRVTAVLQPEFLWSTEVVESADVRLCVQAGAKSLSCNGAASSPRDPLTADWELFLKPHFGVEGWSITAEQSRQSLGGTQQVLQGLPLLAGAALLVALLIGSLEVRRSHRPLNELLQAFRSMARGRFVKLSLSQRRDEYSDIGRAFNQLSRTLRRQFRLLATLESIDLAILERPAVEDLMKSLLPRLPTILDADYAGFTMSEASGRLVLVWSERSGGGIRTQKLSSHAEAVEVFQAMQPQLRWEETPLLVSGVERGRLICGRRRGQQVSRAMHRQAKGVARRFAVALRNEERERQLMRQAAVDELTQLPNRRLLQERVQQALEEAGPAGESFAFVYLDLDRFKPLNDSLGHHSGDELLFQLAGRLSRCLEPEDTVARIGGDEFVLLLRNVTVTSALLRVEHIVGQLRENVQVADISIQPQASIGIAMYPAHGGDFETLLRNADVAMYRGKAAGGGRIVFFEDRMNEQAVRRLQIESSLRQAMGRDQLQLHFQPKVSLTDGELYGAEALLRWTDPELGAVSPAEFIPIAEESELIHELGRMALEQAIAFCRRCLDASVPIGHVAVNVSMLQLCNANLVEFLRRQLSVRRVPPGMLQIEVTESAIMRDAAMVSGVLAEIRELGIRIAIDDFGTGYSSLAVLQHLPVDLLKIDRSFVAQVADSRQSLELVRAMLAVCRALGLQAVAEGVETGPQHELLVEHGCDYAQGYLYSRPVPAAAMMELASGWHLTSSTPPWIMRA